MRFMLFMLGIFVVLINIVETRRVFGPTQKPILPTFYPNPRNKISHKFLPKEEYTVYYEHLLTSKYSPTDVPSAHSSSLPSPTTVISTPDENSYGFGLFVIAFLLILAGITFIVIHQKCRSPSGTYRIPQSSLIADKNYVKFCKIDDEYVEIFEPSILASIDEDFGNAEDYIML